MERLQRILASRGVASRRAAEQMIREGRVSVDGRVVTELGTKADPVRSDIRIDGNLLRRQRSRYILLNKPRGYITTTKDERDRRTVLDLVQVSERVYPVGRLDRVTEGLLLLTNDGDVANRVMHPRYGLAKEYEILTPVRPTAATMDRVRKGVTIDGKRIVPHEFRIVREAREGVLLKIVIHEGLFHVVRRTMEAVGVQVERLRRVRIGPLSVAGIPIGTWRELRQGEERTLFEALGLAQKEGDEDRRADAARRGYGTPPNQHRPHRARRGKPDGPRRQPGRPARTGPARRQTRPGPPATSTRHERQRPASDAEQPPRTPQDGERQRADRTRPRRGGPPEKAQRSRRDRPRRGKDAQYAPERRQERDALQDRRGSVPPGDRDRRPGRGGKDDRRPRRGGPRRRDTL